MARQGHLAMRPWRFHVAGLTVTVVPLGATREAPYPPYQADPAYFPAQLNIHFTPKRSVSEPK